jgi:hypothetical protein
VPSSKQNKKEREQLSAIMIQAMEIHPPKQIFLRVPYSYIFQPEKIMEDYGPISKHYSIKPALTNDQVRQFWKHVISSHRGRKSPFNTFSKNIFSKRVSID